MSTLGKIFTVLVALVSIVVVAFIVRDFYESREWQAEHQIMRKLYDRALAQRSQWEQKADEAYRTMDANRQELQGLISLLRSQVVARDDIIEQKNTEIANQGRKLTELGERVGGLDRSYAKLIEERDTWRGERDRALKERDELMTMYTELDVVHRTLEGQLKDTVENLRQAGERNAALEGRLAWIRDRYPEIDVPEPPPAPRLEKVQGLVTAVDNEARVAEINLGSDDGVVKGMKFFVYDPHAGTTGRYLATLTINKVSHDSAAGELTILMGRVEKNNHVTNRFE